MLRAMSETDYMARQYARPSGWFGRLLVGRLLNRANRRSNAMILNMMAVNPNSDVLDVGFGGADLLRNVATKVTLGTVSGVELSTSMLAGAQRMLRGHAHVQLHHAPVDKRPFADARFDCLVSVNTLYFWDDLTDGLNELARVARPRARLILGFGEAQGMRRAGYADRGFKLYAIDAVVDALDNAGFTLEHIEKQARAQGEFVGLRAR
jgi:arsenite methyltransferase